MMGIKYLHSITEIKKEHCYETGGSKPLRVFCSDLNYYVCKYHKDAGFPFHLFNEYIAASFLQIWTLAVPEFAFVQINKTHTLQTAYPHYYFETIGFGSKYMGDFKEVDKLFIETPVIKKDNETGRNSFLRIALFDIWLSNEDRSFNNFNLLYNFKENIFVPIDHASCFNGNNLDKEPYLITHNESILSSPFLNRFFDRNLQTNSNNIRLSIIDEFKINVSRCHDELDNILSETPLSWKADTDFLRDRLFFLFSEQWTKACLDYFTELFFLHLKSQ
ncbi:MAG: hypothetical protein HXX18_08085 [Bacteroidetes bacterium]|nr:hypothetical protein [Bacteroidota bacterium]